MKTDNLVPEKKLRVDNSTNKKIQSSKTSRDKIIQKNNKGVPDKFVMQLSKMIEKNNAFYQKEISEKSAHIKTQGQSLLEKNAVIKELTSVLATLNKQNEEARTTLINKLDRSFNLIKNHDIGSKKNYIDLQDKLLRDGKK